MSDIRFIMIGSAFVFAGFLILGIFGEQYHMASVQTNEFGNCFEYFDNREPIETNCSEKIFQQNLFFAIVILLIVVGVVLLIKGVRGDWDSKVKPEDMVGPSKDNRSDGNPSK